MTDSLSKGHRQRLRQKFLNAGGNALHDYELLELLLTYSVPRKDVKPIAKTLLKNFTDISAIFDASTEELCKISGISENSVVLFKLIKELCSEYLSEKMMNKDVLSSPESVRDFARMKLAGLKNEAFGVIYLNPQNHVMFYETISEGTINQTTIYPREILKSALTHDATGLILVHNHPSGVCKPSSNDINLTKRIKDIIEMIDISLIDHVIVGKNNYFSFCDKQLL